MFFSKPKSFLGIDIGAGGIKVVELKLEKKRPVLHTYGYADMHESILNTKSTENKSPEELLLSEEEIEEDKKQKETQYKENLDKQAEEKARLIKEICKQSKTISKIAVVSLPVYSVFHSILTLPIVKKEEFGPILRGEAKKLLPRPVEEMALDYQVLEEDKKGRTQKILLNAVPQEQVNFYSSVFQKAGLKLDALEPESVALSRSLVGRDTGVSMVVDMGAERTNFFIIDSGVVITHHSMIIGGNKVTSILKRILGLETDEAEEIKYNLSNYLRSDLNLKIDKEKFYQILHPIIDPMIREIEVAFDLYFRQTANENKRPEKIILTGGASMVPYISDYLSEHFQIKSYLGDPWGRIIYQDSLKPVLQEIGPRMSVAVGLALRNLL